MAIQQGRHHEGHPRAPWNGKTKRLANGLGWFSIGLGLAEVLAPEKVARLIGISDGNGENALIRFYGLREIAAGGGILSRPRPAGWMWGRVAGDLMDLASLSLAMRSEEADRKRLTMAAAAVLGVTALDVYCGRKLSRRSGYGVASVDGRILVTKSITINRSPGAVYSFWHNFENLPTFMNALESVQVTGDRRSHWKVKAPAGMTVEWDAEIIRDEPNALIAWRSTAGSDIDNSGSVRFERAAGGRGTLVRVELEYAPPGGPLAAAVAKLFGAEPGQQVESNLRLLKQILETGDIVRSEASIHPGPHPAQPPAEEPQVPIGRSAWH